MVVLGILGATIVLVIALLLMAARRDRRRGHRIRRADDIMTRIVDARRTIRESEDRWHQTQPWGRPARYGRQERRRSDEFPWLG